MGGTNLLIIKRVIDRVSQRTKKLQIQHDEMVEELGCENRFTAEVKGQLLESKIIHQYLMELLEQQEKETSDRDGCWIKRIFK